MEPTHTAHRCRWALPTLDLPLPDWLDAWAKPWSCQIDGVPRRLDSTDECQTCARWEESVSFGHNRPQPG